MYQPLINPLVSTKELSWEEAQAYCNFVLFKPQDELLEKYKIIETSLRTETSIDFASHRCLLKSTNSLLSIKQFLYDWAPPAWDYPSLWRNPEVSSQESTPIPLPLPVESSIAWVGLNFRRQRAATLNIMRTMIEVTVVEGITKDEDFLELFKALKPTDSTVAEKIMITPFAALTYMWRHKRNASPVPLELLEIYEI